MELNVGMGGEELGHGLGLVRRKVISDDVDWLALGLRGADIGEKGDELRAGVALDCFAQDLSAGGKRPASNRLKSTPRSHSTPAEFRKIITSAIYLLSKPINLPRR